jgi:hypothetical protein
MGGSIIVKVQMPLNAAHPALPALVYARGRVGTTQQTLDSETLRQMGGDVKAFFEAEHDGYRWKIGKRVAFQKW